VLFVPQTEKKSRLQDVPEQGSVQGGVDFTNVALVALYVGQNQSRCMPQSLERHCLSFLAIEDLCHLLLSTKTHARLVARYIRQARAIHFLSAQHPNRSLILWLLRYLPKNLERLFMRYDYFCNLPRQEHRALIKEVATQNKRSLQQVPSEFWNYFAESAELDEAFEWLEPCTNLRWIGPVYAGTTATWDVALRNRSLTSLHFVAQVSNILLSNLRKGML
jgi:hypothetical protein